jgi:hypothetical protein
MSKTSLSLSGLVLALMVAGSAHAATFSFTGSTSTDSSGNTLANTNYSNPGINLTVGGVYAQNGNTALASSGATYDSATLNSGFSTTATWVSQALTFYSGGGLAMSSDGSSTPNHALDNAGQNTEAVLMQFSSSVVLSSLNLGYIASAAGFASTGSDVSVLRWTGAGAPTTSGFTAVNTLSNGWSLVGNYGGLAQADDAINSGGLGSSWWLVSAYNSAFGAATSGTVNQGNDFFKIAAVTATACTGTAAQCGTTSSGGGGKLPEPSSLALVGVALLGAARVKRSRRAAKGKLGA